jgi:hypothetical protein
VAHVLGIRARDGVSRDGRGIRASGGHASLQAFAESRRQSLVPFLYASRGLSVAAGVFTVGLVYLAGKRAFGRQVGLVAAFFLGIAYLHVRDSHFGVTDVPMTAFVVLSVVAALRWREQPSAWRAAYAGVAVGLAGTTRIQRAGERSGVRHRWLMAAIALRHTNAPQSRAVLASLPVFAVAVVMMFFAGSPYILVNWSRFVGDVGTLQATAASGHGMALGRGWSYYPAVILPAAVGWPMWLAALAGLVWLMVVRTRETLIVFAVPIGYYLAAGGSAAVFARTLPLIPFICLAAAWMVCEGTRVAGASPGRRFQPAIVALAAVLVAAPTILNTVLVDRLLATRDNRSVVADAVRTMVPDGSSFFQSGERYGHVPLERRGAALRLVRFDPTADLLVPGNPAWILIKRSTLALYSAVPGSIERLLAEHVRRATFLTDRSPALSRVYDQRTRSTCRSTTCAVSNGQGPGSSCSRGVS